eukprot:05034_3
MKKLALALSQIICRSGPQGRLEPITRSMLRKTIWGQTCVYAQRRNLSGEVRPWKNVYSTKDTGKLCRRRRIKHGGS